MRTLAEIDNEIVEVKSRLEAVEGRETEVYSRIVGYYRSLRNWNKGKKEEFRQRLTFDGRLEDSPVPALHSAAGAAPLGPARGQGELWASGSSPAGEGLRDSGAAASVEVSSYAYFFRKTCPNCAPVKELMNKLPITGAAIDVDSEDGLAEAMSTGVFSTPTVVFYDHEGKSVFQGQDVKAIQEFFAPLFSV
jgi:hypothetical protein